MRRKRRPDQTDQWFLDAASRMISDARHAEQAFEALDAPGVPALLQKLVEVQDAGGRVLHDLMIKTGWLPQGSEYTSELDRREHDRRAHARRAQERAAWRRRKTNPDEEYRLLQRAARTGDPHALARLKALARRLGKPLLGRDPRQKASAAAGRRLTAGLPSDEELVSLIQEEMLGYLSQGDDDEILLQGVVMSVEDAADAFYDNHVGELGPMRKKHFLHLIDTAVARIKAQRAVLA